MIRHNMPPPRTGSLPLNRRFLTLLLGAVGIITILSLLISVSSRGSQQPPLSSPSTTSLDDSALSAAQHLSPSTLQGSAISGALGNETVKAELGRAAWKLFHTTMARFPQKPSADEQTALVSYIHLFARLYPCGECASHFQQILKKFPPQVRTRETASAWGCHVHNEVNKSLKKEVFDCEGIEGFYDCGCGKEGEEGKTKESEPGKEKEKEKNIDLEVQRNG